MDLEKNSSKEGREYLAPEGVPKQEPERKVRLKKGLTKIDVDTEVYTNT